MLLRASAKKASTSVLCAANWAVRRGLRVRSGVTEGIHTIRDGTAWWNWKLLIAKDVFGETLTRA